MGIDHLFGDTPPNGQPVPRLTPRSPVSIKELTGILIFGGLVWGAYTQMSKFAEKTSVDKIIESQWQQRLETQHRFDVLENKLDALSKAQTTQGEASQGDWRRKK